MHSNAYAASSEQFFCFDIYNVAHESSLNIFHKSDLSSLTWFVQWIHCYEQPSHHGRQFVLKLLSSFLYRNIPCKVFSQNIIFNKVQRHHYFPQSNIKLLNETHYWQRHWLLHLVLHKHLKNNTENNGWVLWDKTNKNIIKGTVQVWCWRNGVRFAIYQMLKKSHS